MTDIMEQTIKAAGMGALVVVSDLITKLGPLGGFFSPYINKMLGSLSTFLGISSNTFSKLIDQPAILAANNLKKQTSVFAEIWNDVINFFNPLKKKQTPQTPKPSPTVKDTMEDVKKTSTTKSQDQAFKKIYDIAVKLNDPIPELTAAMAMYESGWLNPSNKNNRNNNPFNQKSIHGGYKVYKSLDDAVKDHIDTWATKMPNDAGPGYGTKTGAPIEGFLTILETYAPKSENDQPTYISGIKSILKTYGFDSNKKNDKKQLSAESGASIGSSFGNILGSTILQGSNSGYDVNDNLKMHGTEALVQHPNGMSILPIENNKYSLSKNPKSTINRWQNIMNSGVSNKKSFETGGKWSDANLDKIIQKFDAPPTLGFPPGLVAIGGGNSGGPFALTSKAAESFFKMRDAAKKDGVDLSSNVITAWRNPVYQENLIWRHAHGDKNVANADSAYPSQGGNVSKHIQGLSLDLGEPSQTWVIKNGLKFDWKLTHGSGDERHHFDFLGGGGLTNLPNSRKDLPNFLTQKTLNGTPDTNYKLDSVKASVKASTQKSFRPSTQSSTNNTFMNIFDKINSFLSNPTGTINSTFTNGLNSVNSFLDNPTGTINSTFTNSLSSVNSFLDNPTDTINSKFINGIDSVATKIKSFFNINQNNLNISNNSYQSTSTPVAIGLKNDNKPSVINLNNKNANTGGEYNMQKNSIMTIDNPVIANAVDIVNVGYNINSAKRFG